MVEFFRFQFLSLLINDVIMASLLLLKTINVSANFIILLRKPCYFGICRFMAALGGKIDKNLGCANASYSTIRRQIT